MVTSTLPDVRPLRLTDPLPRGVTVLEASAGTGKTYAIAAIVTRAVAEGVCDLPHILVVTFTRAATAELRDRIRRRLVEAADHLAACVTAIGANAPAPVSDDDVLTALVDGQDLVELARRRDRLVTATREFDAATISTIHGFTHQVLRSVGLSVGVPRDVELLEDPSDLIGEVVDDVTLRRFLDHDPDDPDLPAPPSRSTLGDLASAVITRPDARVVPEPDDPDPDAAQLGAIAAEFRAEAARRKHRLGVLGHDDLLIALRDALADADRGAEAVAVLRSRYRLALVDEFQDTDPIQWEILADAFAGPDEHHRALVLIGDPKQAIYAFRGADVATYLRAVETADTTTTLGTNWRTDAPLLTALEPLLGGTRFGDDRIVFRPVAAAPGHDASALTDAVDEAVLQLRVVHDPPTGSNAAAVRQHVAHDVAATVVRQLREVRLGPDGTPLRPRQIAVLVRANYEAAQVQRALRALDVPSVVNGVGSVFATEAADDWRWLLDALERPADAARARRFAVSAWNGWDATELARADLGGPDTTTSGRSWDTVHDQLHRWAAVLRDHGIATLERVVTRETRVAERLLSRTGGERHLTDLRHVGQLLHTAELHDERGVTALRSWLLDRRADADDGTPPEEEARRLESDDEAVQILTIHRAKGLEFEVVLAPFLWGAGLSPRCPITIDDPEGDGRLIDAGPTGRAGYRDHQDVAAREQVGEALRLAYVAVTRARHRVVLWWACIKGSAGSPLARLLFRGPDGEVPLDEAVTLPDGGAPTVARLRERFDDVAVSVERVPDAPERTAWAGPDRSPVTTLTARSFDRSLDRAWHRTSYSGLLRRAERLHDAAGAVASETDEPVKDDEPDGADPLDAAPPTTVPEPLARDEMALRSRPVPMGDLRGGTAFGTLVHAVLEHLDFAAPDLGAAVRATIDDQARLHGLEVDHDRLHAGLVAAVTSPLGPLAGTVDDPEGGARSRRLRDVPRRDRLDELTFELPLAGGDDARQGGRAVALSRLAHLLDRPPVDGGLADDDPLRLAGYADRLRTPGYALDLRGYLTGAIDLILRVPGDDGHRYLVADHKTNRLAWPEPPTAWDHRPSALTAAMMGHDYPLQALLYQVALHRFLAWRLPDYDPQRHLGGSLYLFLRGMLGPDTPSVGDGPLGVFAWRPPAELVVDLSELLAGGDV